MGDWQSIFKKSGKVFLKPQEDMQKVINLFKREKVKRILDLGCGTGNGYGYIVGGYIETEFFFTPTDAERLPEEFPFSGVELGNFRLSTAYTTPPKSWAKSDFTYEKRKYDEGWLQLRIGLNTDKEGKLLTEDVIKEKQEKKGFLKKIKHVSKKVSRLIELPDEKEAFWLWGI